MTIKIFSSNLEKLQNLSELCKGFLYLSPWISLFTKGCYTPIELPSSDGSELKGMFQEQLKYFFNLAKKNGIINPIIVGAIPFDVSNKSSLFIPESYQMFNRIHLLTTIKNNINTLKSNANFIYIPNHDTFINMVYKALLAIEKRKIDKIVLSRLVDIIIDDNIDIHQLMGQIIIQNPYIYQFHLPLSEGRALIGASPELIIRKKGRFFISCPLAGSAKRNKNNFLYDNIIGKDLLNSYKNRYEHDIVVRAIASDLLPRSRVLIIPKIPSVISTSTLLHLSSKIYGEISNIRENALSLACLLHPTPALCGFPYQNALEIIKELEPFKRELFGGMIGWCDSFGNGEWVVTIRCAVTNDNNQYARLFAGAGIVKNSEPELEWEETSLKLKSMMNAFSII